MVRIPRLNVFAEQTSIKFALDIIAMPNYNIRY